VTTKQHSTLITLAAGIALRHHVVADASYLQVPHRAQRSLNGIGQISLMVRNARHIH
jgi:hypothetical protein